MADRPDGDSGGDYLAAFQIDHRLVWYVPVAIDASSSLILRLLSGGLMSYLTGSVAALAYGMRHAKRYQLAIAPLVIIGAGTTV